MKTSIAIIKPGKSSEDKEVIKKKKITGSKSAPSEDDIREKAMEIYQQRNDRGEQGTAEDDWLEAEMFLRD
jgi:hypothetical protein